jgi:hypothetical protein
MAGSMGNALGKQGTDMAPVLYQVSMVGAEDRTYSVRLAVAMPSICVSPIDKGRTDTLGLVHDKLSFYLSE